MGKTDVTELLKYSHRGNIEQPLVIINRQGQIGDPYIDMAYAANKGMAGLFIGLDQRLGARVRSVGALDPPFGDFSRDFGLAVIGPVPGDGGVLDFFIFAQFAKMCHGAWPISLLTNLPGWFGCQLADHPAWVANR